MNNGAILPYGLLGSSDTDLLSGFNKTYKNTPLRVGVVLEAYPTTSDKNVNKLTPEYKVCVVEQQEDRGSTTIIYPNCMSSEGLGSIADFFEKTIRFQTTKTSKGSSTNLKDQDGAIVLLLCLDGMSDKGIIVSFLTHPDRKKTLLDEGPRLEGEFNGLNIKVEKDGSAQLTFRGATNNQGQPLDKEQGNTELLIEKDGSIQMKHKSIIYRLEKSGNVNLAADGDISSTSKKNISMASSDSVSIKSEKNTSINSKDLLLKASGSAMLESQKLTVKSESEIKISGSEFKVEAEALVKIKATSVTIDGLVNLGGDGGQPVLILSSMIMGTGNMGAPVISSAITGAVKVMAQ